MKIYINIFQNIDIFANLIYHRNTCYLLLIVIMLNFIFTDSLLLNSNFNIITLPHPGTRKPAKYCVDNENNKIYEVVTFDEPYRSWFIGETVKSDGSVQIFTPLNPLFLGKVHLVYS